jgi:NAD(P)H dehydrogenase (quinone)
MSARIAVIYYSATGNVHRLAQAVAEGAEHAGGEVRLRHVEELASEQLISHNQLWGRHRSQVDEAPVATLDDLSSGPTVSPSARQRGSATSPRS